MNGLCVYYDAHCPFCVRCAAWMASEDTLVPMQLIPADSPVARDRCGQLPWLGAELLVVDDSGRFWAGPAAFLVCLWALRRTRWLGFALACPALLPLARRSFAALSANRAWLSTFLVGEPCAEGCRVPPRMAYR